MKYRRCVNSLSDVALGATYFPDEIRIAEKSECPAGAGFEAKMLWNAHG